MTTDKYSIIMRILDEQNRLTDRADNKAISLLTALGLFTIIFVAQLNSITGVTPVIVVLLVIYCISVVLAVLHIVIAISPRIRKIKTSGRAAAQPTFFSGISAFQDAESYGKCLDELVHGDEAINDIYVRQVYEVSKINKIKYKYIGRAVWFVVITLISQIALIVFIFSLKLGQL